MDIEDKDYGLTSRDIIANHIENEEYAEEFRNGGKKGYEIVGLDLSRVPDFDFSDGTDYSFINCTIKNRKLGFSGKDILFQNCTFGGDIEIPNCNPNSEVKDLLSVQIQECKSDGTLNTFSVSSPKLSIMANDMRSKEKMTFTSISVIFEPWIDEDGNVCVENNIGSESEVIIDSTKVTVDRSQIESPDIQLRGYDLFRMRFADLKGTLTISRRGMGNQEGQVEGATEFAYETLIIDSKINGERINPLPEKTEDDVKER